MSEDDQHSRRRRWRQDPEDAANEAFYEAELLRAGQTDTVKERFRFEFLCPVKWEELEGEERTSQGRFCDHCQKDVFFVETEEEFLERCARGQCIAILASEADGRLDALAEAASQGEAGRPHCIVTAAQRPPRPGPRKRGVMRGRSRR